MRRIVLMIALAACAALASCGTCDVAAEPYTVVYMGSYRAPFIYHRSRQIVPVYRTAPVRSRSHAQIREGARRPMPTHGRRGR